MKNLSIILTVIAAILLIVAIISRVTVTPISFIAPKVESQALGQLASILLLFAISINTLNK
jgi:hypothetical protein